jgi:Asp-tRNA(Asn)/Glu-tRNA(Gln) amidotransferase A subunit family amidase
MSIATRSTCETGAYTPLSGLRPYFTARAQFLSGNGSPRHYLEHCLAEIEQRDGAVKAFVALNVAAARRAADDASVRYRSNRALGDIDGMPIGIKDIIETKGLETGMNSPIFDGFLPRRDAASVLALKAAGAVIVGKTATAEFACGRSAETRNPIDLARTPGGSSSGSAAAVGAGMIPAALGTQTQASIIRPSSFCGAYGFKPSLGSLSLDGVAPLSSTLDHLGVIGASLIDLWATAFAIRQASPARAGDPYHAWHSAPGPKTPVRLIRLRTKGWTETDAQSKEAFEQAVRKIAAAGVEVFDAEQNSAIEKLEQELILADRAAVRIYGYESQWPLRAYAACGADLVGPRVHELIEIGLKMTASDYAAALEARDRLRQLIMELQDQADGFLTLASSGPAIVDIAYTGSRSFAVPATMIGAPAFSLPVLESGGLPVGLQYIGFPGADTAALARALWLDQLFLQ